MELSRAWMTFVGRLVSLAGVYLVFAPMKIHVITESGSAAMSCLPAIQGLGINDACSQSQYGQPLTAAAVFLIGFGISLAAGRVFPRSTADKELG